MSVNLRYLGLTDPRSIASWGSTIWRKSVPTMDSSREKIFLPQPSKIFLKAYILQLALSRAGPRSSSRVRNDLHSCFMSLGHTDGLFASVSSKRDRKFGSVEAKF